MWNQLLLACTQNNVENLRLHKVVKSKLILAFALKAVFSKKFFTDEKNRRIEMFSRTQWFSQTPEALFYLLLPAIAKIPGVRKILFLLFFPLRKRFSKTLHFGHELTLVSISKLYVAWIFPCYFGCKIKEVLISQLNVLLIFQAIYPFKVFLYDGFFEPSIIFYFQRKFSSVWFHLFSTFKHSLIFMKFSCSIWKQLTARNISINFLKGYCRNFLI